MTAQQQKDPTAAAGPAADDHHGAPGFLGRASTARILPFAVYMAFIVIADGLARLGLGEAELRWLYPVKIVAVVAVLVAYRRAYAELAWRTMSARCALGSTAVGVIVLVLWVNLDAGWMLIGEPAGFNPTAAGGGIDWSLVVLRIAGAALVVPVMEELFWRSFLMRWLAHRDFLNVYPARVGVQAFLVTALLFGFEHNLWLAGIVAGVAYAWLYMRSGNLWAPILAHAVTNGLLGVWIVMTSNWSFW